jgi:hypothetical protein
VIRKGRSSLRKDRAPPQIRNAMTVRRQAIATWVCAFAKMPELAARLRAMQADIRQRAVHHDREISRLHAAAQALAEAATRRVGSTLVFA